MEPKQCLQWKRISSGQQIVSCIYSPKHKCRFKIVSRFIQSTCSCLWVPKENSTQHNNSLYKPFHCPEQRCSQGYKKKSNPFHVITCSLYPFTPFGHSLTLLHPVPNPLDPSFPIWWIAPPPKEGDFVGWHMLIVWSWWIDGYHRRKTPASQWSLAIPKHILPLRPCSILILCWIRKYISFGLCECI